MKREFIIAIERDRRNLRCFGTRAGRQPYAS